MSTLPRTPVTRLKFKALNQVGYINARHVRGLQQLVNYGPKAETLLRNYEFTDPALAAKLDVANCPWFQYSIGGINFRTYSVPSPLLKLKYFEEYLQKWLGQKSKSLIACFESKNGARISGTVFGFFSPRELAKMQTVCRAFRKTL